MDRCDRIGHEQSALSYLAACLANGWIASLMYMTLHAHRISHMKHHAYTNNSEREPDYFVAGPFWKLFPKIGLITVLRTVMPILTLFPNGTFLLRGQNHHILHHTFPRVPHYRLPALFRKIRPILEAHEVRIERPLAGPGAPPILLR